MSGGFDSDWYNKAFDPVGWARGDYRPLNIPPYPPPPAGAAVVGAVTPRETLAKTARSAQKMQAQGAAENAPIRITYGTDRIGAQVADVLVYLGKWVFILIWGEGPIDSVQTLEMDDKALPAGVTVAHYTGAAGQSADATLIAAYAAQSPSVIYADDLAGIAYSVVLVPPALLTGEPQFAAIIKGRLLYNPATGLTIYSDNPSLALRDFITSTVYGLSKTATDASVIAAAAANDELVGGVKRRTIGLTIDTVKKGEDWLATLSTYAGCWTPQDAGIYTLIPDRPRATDDSYLHADGDIVALHDLTKRGVLGVPTVVDIGWTDTSASPWRERSAIAKLAGVDLGATSRRESVVPLPGIHTYAQAMREAIERLNKLNLGDLDADISVFDRGIAVEIGDVLQITHPIGLTAKTMRCLGVSGENGRYRFALSEYDPAMYSDAVESGPSQTDTTLPSPQTPPAVTGLTLTEELYQLMNGTWASRLRAAWTASASPFIDSYRVELVLAGEILDSSTVTASTEYATPPVPEGEQYTVRVYALTSVASSPAATQTATLVGKSAPPSDVSSLTGFEAGGTVYLAWTAVVDFDIWRYELRYGLVSDTWDEATFLDRVDALRHSTKQIPVGSWRIFVKALDSVALYSATAATLDITVTLDNASFLADSVEFDTPTLTRMSSFTLGRTDGIARAVTEDGVAFGTKFPAVMNTYTNPLASYSSSGASSWVSESHDFGTLLSGDWSAEISGSALSGSLTKTLQLSEDDVVWVDYTALTAKATARYARVRLDAAGTAVIYALAPTMHVRINVVPRTEQGFVVTGASGPTVIQLKNIYVAAKSIQITPLGTVSRQAVYNNVALGNQDYYSEDFIDPAYTLGNVDTFDIYLFDISGAQVGGEVAWRFEGV